jgi:hypothetical protein
MHSSHNHDRRKWRRSQGRVSRLTVWAGEKSNQEAVVLDESLAGIALLVEDGTAFHVDQEVRLTHRKREVFATVRHVLLREDGNYHLGLEWGPCEVKPASLLFLLKPEIPINASQAPAS